MKTPVYFALLAALAIPHQEAAATEIWAGEIVSAATKTPKSAETAPGAVSVVGRRDISVRAIQTADQALNTLPGVFDRRGKGLMDTSSALTLRGIPDQKRTLVLMDGVPMNDAYTGAVAYGGMPIEDIEQIEVARGPFSGLYGGNAMGGVINFIPHRPLKREITIKTGYGGPLKSDNAMRRMMSGYVSYGDKLNSRLSVFGSFGAKRTDGYPSDLNVQSSKPTTGLSGWSGTTDNKGAARYLIGDKGSNGWKENNAVLRSWYDLSDSDKLNVSVTRTESDYFYGNPNSYLSNASGDQVWKYGTVQEASFLSGPGGRVQNTYSTGYNKTLDAADIKLSGGIIDTGRSWYITPGTTASTTRSGGPGKIAETPAFSWNSDLQASVPDIIANNSVTGGMSVRAARATTKERDLANWNIEASKGALTYRSSGKNSDFGAFIQDEIRLHKTLTGYVAARGDWWRTYDGLAEQPGTDGYPKHYDTRDSSAFSPKASLVYDPVKNTTFRASAGKSFRSPTVYELYRTWTSGTVVYEANPDLGPERVFSWDTGVERKLWFGCTAGATYFQNRMDGLIYRQSVSTTLKRYENAAKAYGRGWEFEAEQVFHEGGRIFANLTLNNAKILKNPANPASEGQKLVDVPAKTYAFGGDWRFGRFGLSTIGRYVGKRYTDDANLDLVNGVYSSRDPYFVADAKATMDITSGLSVSLSAANIFNKIYYDYYLAPGRSWLAELTYKI